MLHPYIMTVLLNPPFCRDPGISHARGLNCVRRSERTAVEGSAWTFKRKYQKERLYKMLRSVKTEKNLSILQLRPPHGQPQPRAPTSLLEDS